jgi:virginiamycin B lyase
MRRRYAARRRRYHRRQIGRLVGILTVLGILGLVPATALGANFARFSVPTKHSGLWGLVLGPDGNVWFTESVAGKIGRLTPRGKIREFSLAPGETPQNYLVVARGKVWFIYQSPRVQKFDYQLASITPRGKITRYRSVHAFWAFGMASDFAGNVWWRNSSYRGGGYGVRTASGAIKLVPIPDPFNANYSDMVGDSGTGTVWLVGNRLDRINTAGQLLESHPVPPPASGEQPTTTMGAIMDDTGALWFQTNDYRIGRLGPDGTIRMFSNPLVQPRGGELFTGPDGEAWMLFTDEVGDPYFARLKNDGSFGHQNQSPTSRHVLTTVAGKDGNLWYVIQHSNYIYRLHVRP